MREFFTDPVNRTFVFPFLGTVALVVLIRVLGRAGYGRRFAAAAVAAAFLWVIGMVLGIPEFPPAEGTDSLAYFILVAWLLGLLLDFLRHDPEAGAWSELGALALCGVGSVWWLWFGTSMPVQLSLTLLGALAALVLWLVVAVRLRWVARNPRVSTVMLAALALGIAVNGWLAVLPDVRDVAGGLAVVLCGFLLPLLLGLPLQFASSLLLPVTAALLFLGYQLCQAPDLSGATLLFLLLIPFADSVSRRIEIPLKFLAPAIRLFALAGLALLPVIISALATMVELKFRA